MFLIFCSDDSNSIGKVNKRRTIYGKLVGNGSVMENYAGCSSSCNSHNPEVTIIGILTGDDRSLRSSCIHYVLMLCSGSILKGGLNIS